MSRYHNGPAAAAGARLPHDLDGLLQHADIRIGVGGDERRGVMEQIDVLKSAGRGRAAVQSDGFGSVAVGGGVPVRADRGKYRAL